MAFDHNKKLVEFAQGSLVEEDLLGVIQRIQAFDPNLTVQYLDPQQHSDLTDAPFRILETCPDGHKRLVFSVWELDDRVLERLWNADTLKHDILGQIDSKNALAKKGEQQRYQEQMLALNEMSADVLKSPKDTYKATNPVTGEDHKFTWKRKT